MMTIANLFNLSAAIQAIENDGKKPNFNDRIYTDDLLRQRYYAIREYVRDGRTTNAIVEPIIDGWCKAYLPSGIYHILQKRRDRRTYITFFDEIEEDTAKEIENIEAFCALMTKITGVEHTYEPTGCDPTGKPIFWGDGIYRVDFKIKAGDHQFDVDLKVNDKTTWCGTWKIKELEQPAKVGAWVLSSIVDKIKQTKTFYMFSPEVSLALCKADIANQFEWYSNDDNSIVKRAIRMMTRQMSKWLVCEEFTLTEPEIPTQEVVDRLTEAGFINRPKDTRPCI